MIKITTMSNEAIRVTIVKEQLKRDLAEVLNSVRGKKGLVLDPKLSGLLGLVAEVSFLRDHGVEKIYHLDDARLDTECKNIIYIVRPRMELMRLIASHIRNHELQANAAVNAGGNNPSNRKGDANANAAAAAANATNAGEKKTYSVFFVPRRTMICQHVLEEEGVYGSIMSGEFPMDLIPFDDDVLSLELDNAFKDCFLDGDKTALHYVARSIMKLQAIFGIIPNIKGKGSGAKMVADQILRMRKESLRNEAAINPEIDTLVLIDRTVDPYTPMLTQLTYEGLIDELMGITNTFVDVDPEDVGATAKPGQKKTKLPLNGFDKLYSEIRDLNFGLVGPLLHNKAKNINENYKQKDQAQTVAEIRDFMKKLNSLQQEHQSLRVHTSIAQRIMDVTKEPAFHNRLEMEQSLILGQDSKGDYIEDCIHRQEPLLSSLRLLCLQSLTSGGLKQKQFDFYRRELLQTYGYHHLFTLHNLEKIGFFKRSESKNNWPNARKALKLWVDDLNESNPNDIAYTFSGYAPVSVRCVQALVTSPPPPISSSSSSSSSSSTASIPSIPSIQSSLPLPSNILGGKTGVIGGGHSSGSYSEMYKAMVEYLPGPIVDEVQTLPLGTQASDGKKQKVILVYFIGGVTFAEISAIRFLNTLSAEEGGGRSYVICTTKLISGNSLINSLVTTVNPV